MKSVPLTAVLILAGAAAAYSQTPAVAAGGVLNAASYERGQAVAPGSLVSVFGTDLASALALADSVPLSTSLGNVSVAFNSIPAPLSFVSSGQINAQLPWNVLPAGTQIGTAQVVVTRGGVASAPQGFQVASAAPGIFTLSGTGAGQAIAYGNSDYAFAAPVGAVGPPYSSHPAKIGDPTTLVILATGLGPVNPSVANGAIPPSGVLSTTVTTPVVLVGGVPAQVFFSGMSPYVGVYQLNIIIAAGTPTGDAVSVQVQMNGITTSDKVTIAVTK